MLRSLIALAALTIAAAPGFADTCSAATDAATRAALDNAAAKGQRTATVRVACGGKTEAFVIHRTETARGTSVSVRAVKAGSASRVIKVDDKPGFGGSTSARLIRVGD